MASSLTTIAMLAVLCAGIAHSVPSVAIDPTHSLNGEDLPGNSLQNKDAVLRQTSRGLALAMGAELTWRRLPEDIKCLVKHKYMQDEDPSIFVVEGRYDNAEHILNALQIRFRILTVAQLKDGNFTSSPKGKTLFLNSGVNLREAAALKAVRSFVHNGGVLVTSNFAGENLKHIFAKQRLDVRTLTTLGVSSRYAALNVEGTPATVHQTQVSMPERRGSDDCERSIEFLHKPAEDVVNSGMNPLWALEETPLSLSAGKRSSNNKVISIINSHDLTSPFDSVLSCFNRRKGSVYHFMGRLFQLPQTAGTDHRLDQRPVPFVFSQDLLKDTFDGLDENSRQQNTEALRQRPPPMQDVTSAALTTGMVMRLLAREWKRADLEASINYSDVIGCS